MKRIVKRTVERAIVASGVAKLARARRAPASTLVLAFHDIVPAGHDVSGDASLHLPQEDFARQLDALRAWYEIVPLEALLNEPIANHPRVAITFDDAYAGALEAGVSELASRGMPATIFVAPGLLSEVPWWDLLAGPDGELPPLTRSYALWKLTGLREKGLDWADSGGWQPPKHLSESLRIGTLAQLERVAAVPGITFGSHSWSHANLQAVSPGELERELVQPMDWLRARFDCYVPILGYPYGLFSPTVQQAAQRVGYRAAYRVDGGWLSRWDAAQRYALPRYNVPSGLSFDGFRLRLSGIWSQS